MTNQLTQAELIDLAQKAGFYIGGDDFGNPLVIPEPGRTGHVLDDMLQKFAQLIQQRQGEAVEPFGYAFPIDGGRYDFTGYQLHQISEPNRTEIALYITPPASQLVAQALEKAATIVTLMLEPEFDSVEIAQAIRALKDQPVEQGGDELVEALETIADYPLTRDQEMGIAAMRKIAREALANRRGGE